MTRLVLALCLALAATPCLAGERYAVVVTGASGGDDYTRKYDTWRVSFVSTLEEKFGFDRAHLFVLADHESAGVLLATRASVQRVFGELRQRLAKDDLLFVLLIGHGTLANGEDAKFNLVGPDLSASEWSDLLKPIPGRLVFVDTSAASFPFMQKLAGRGRIVLTATDAAAQQFETVFPEFFIKAFEDPAADLDKNGRISLWEAFSYASAGVQQWFDQHGQLPTERPLLDDDGDGVGREAQNPGARGTLARTVYLDPDAASDLEGGATLTTLQKAKTDLERQIDALKGRKASMSPDAYAAELERLLLELARVSQQIRTKS